MNLGGGCGWQWRRKEWLLWGEDGGTLYRAMGRDLAVYWRPPSELLLSMGREWDGEMNTVRAFRKRTKVARDRGVSLKKVPFQPGTSVEVIVVPARAEVPPIYRLTAAAVKRRRLPQYSLKEIERIVHESRGVRA